MKRINRLSDFTLTVALKNSEGEHITPPSTPWEIHIADAAGTCWRCSFDGTSYEDCAVVDEQIICFVDNPGFVSCAARITFHNNVPDDNFGDGVYNQVVPLTDEVYFYDGPTDNDGEIETSLILEYFSAQEHNYVTEEELDADLQQLTAEVAATYATKAQVEGKLSKDELGSEVAKYTQLAVHFTGGPNDGVWRYYDGAKNIVSIIDGTAEEGTYAGFVVSLGYKMQGLDAIKPCVMDIVSGENNTVKAVDYIPFVGFYDGDTALFTALGNSADESADATDVVSVHYILDIEHQSWQRAEFDFTNHIFDLESSVSGLERSKADKTQLADYLTTSAAASTYLSKSEAQSTYAAISDVLLLEDCVTALRIQMGNTVTWKYVRGTIDFTSWVGGGSIGDEITIGEFMLITNAYNYGAVGYRVRMCNVVIDSNYEPTDFEIYDLAGWLPSAGSLDNAYLFQSLESSGLGGTWVLGYDSNALLTWSYITPLRDAISGKADKVDVRSATSSASVAVALEPNVMYTFGTTDVVNVLLATPSDNTVVNVYAFTFTAQSSSCTVTLPSNVELGNDYSWEFEAGRKYEVSIYDNIALVAYADASNS